MVTLGFVVAMCGGEGATDPCDLTSASSGASSSGRYAWGSGTASASGWGRDATIALPETRSAYLRAWLCGAVPVTR